VSEPLRFDKAVFALWGVIRNSAYRRLNTAQVWKEVRDVLGTPQGRLPEGTFQLVNKLRSAAVQIREAATTITNLDPHEPLPLDKIPRSPFLSTAAELGLPARWIVTIRGNFLTETGEVVHDFRAITFYNPSFHTKAQILEAYQSALATLYSVGRSNSKLLLDYDLIEVQIS
jgi:hypothetical protein